MCVAVCVIVKLGSYWWVIGSTRFCNTRVCILGVLENSVVVVVYGVVEYDSFIETRPSYRWISSASIHKPDLAYISALIV